MKLPTIRRRQLVEALAEVTAQSGVFLLAATAPIPAEFAGHVPPLAAGLVAAGFLTMAANKVQTKDMYGNAERPVRFLWRTMILLATSITMFITLYRAAEHWLPRWFDSLGIGTRPAAFILAFVAFACLVAVASDVITLWLKWSRAQSPAARNARAAAEGSARPVTNWIAPGKEEAARMAEAATTIARDRAAAEISRHRKI